MWPPSPPPAPPGQGSPLFEPQQLVRLAPRLLAPPLEQWDEGMVADLPAVRGGYGGRRATLRVVQANKARAGGATNSLRVELEGPTHGAVCWASAPAVLRNEPPTGDAEFDALYEFSTVPRAIGPLVSTPEVRAQLKATRPGGLRVEDGRVTFMNGDRPRTLEQIAAQLALAATLLDRVPEAMRAVGGPAYAAGAPHPEVVQHARNRRLVRTLLVVGLALIIGGPLLVAAVVAGVVSLSGEPEATAAAATAELDLLRPGTLATLGAQPGQRLDFRATVDLDPRLGSSRATRSQASANVRASTLVVTVVAPDGTARALTCPPSGAGTMSSTGQRLRFAGLKLGCSYVADQAGTHRVLAAPRWRNVSPAAATLRVDAAGRP